MRGCERGTLTSGGVVRGESTLVINYRNHRGELVNEVLTFNGDGLVSEGHGTYLV
jgi:hypothetical protein